MNSVSSTRCIFCRLLPTKPGSFLRSPRRKLHSTPVVSARRKPSFTNVRAVDLGLVAQSPPEKTKAVSASPAKRAVSKGTKHEVKPVPLTELSQGFRKYSPREMQLAALKYTPEQMAALRAAERTIKGRDMTRQGRMRDDAWRIEYKDDFSKVLPWLDHPVRAPDEDIDPDIRPLTEEETNMRFTAFYKELLQREKSRLTSQFTELQDPAPLSHEQAQEVTQSIKYGEDGTEITYMPPNDSEREFVDPDSFGITAKTEGASKIMDGIYSGVHPFDGLTPEQRIERLRAYAEKHEMVDYGAAFLRFTSDPANFFHSPKGKLHSQQDVAAQELPKINDPRLITIKEGEDPALESLALSTGRSIDEINKLLVKPLVTHRVVNQTRMGKIQSFYVLSIAGDRHGMLGVGEGKSVEGDEAFRKSKLNAVRNMKPVPRYEERTIYGDVEAKVGASIVKLSARSPGFGNRGQSLIFELARAAGIRDISARCQRSRNKMNVVKAAYAALMSQRLPDEVARSRGRKMVDVRHVYYSGQVLSREEAGIKQLVSAFDTLTRQERRADADIKGLPNTPQKSRSTRPAARLAGGEEEEE